MMNLVARYFFWFGIVGLAATWGGGQNTYTAMKNSEPTSMTCADFMENGTDQEWLLLTECRVDWMEAAYEGSESSPTKLYMPVRATGAESGDTTKLVLVTESEEWTGALGAIVALPEDDDGAGLIALGAKYPNLGATSLEIQGLVQFGIDLKDSERDEVKGLVGNLSEDFAMLEDGGKPNMGMGLGMLGLGIACLGLAVVGGLRSAA